MRVFNKIICIIFLPTLLFSCAKSKHKIGSMYKGGYVFKINIFGHGLCAAPNDYAKAVQWGCYGTLINGADGEKIGTGQQNTKDIVSGCSMTVPYAAKVCDELVVDNYDDWYLPSIEELQLMQRELYVQGFGNFKPGAYWSSTQNFSLGAWKVDFTSGEKSNNTNKQDKGVNVRAIRSF